MTDTFVLTDDSAPPPAEPAPPPVPASAPEGTNEYDALLAQAPPASDRKPTGNEYDSVVIDMKRERQQRLRATAIAAQGSTPEVAAKALQLSGKTGLPSDLVERNLPKVAAEQKLNEYDALLGKSPKLAAWLTADPINAKVADSEGDFSKLSLIEEGVNEITRGVLGQQANSNFAGWKTASRKLGELESALQKQARGEYLSPFDRAMIGQEETIRQTMKDAIINYGGQFYERQAQAAELPMRPVVAEMQKAGEAGDWGGMWEALKKDPLGAIYSISMQSAYLLPFQLGAFAVAGPGGAFGVSFLAEYMGAVTDAMKEAGVNIADPTQVTQAFNDPALMAKVERQATIKAGTIGAVDAASLRLARVPMGMGKSAVTREATNIVAQMGVQAGAGAFGEAAGSTLAGMKVDPFAVVSEALGEMGSAPVEVATARWTQAIKQDATREQFEKYQALPPLERIAIGQALVVDRLLEQVTNTKIAALSPEKLQEFIGSLSDVVQSVFVPAQAVATYMQDMTGLQAKQFVERLGIADQIERARVSGEDIAIPLANYLTGASEAHKAWRNDLRTEVDGFSVRQAQEWESRRQAETQAALARFEEQIAAGIGEIEPQTRVYQTVLERLKNSGQYTNEVAAQHAALYAAHYAARAARNPGLYTDAYDAYEKAGTGKGVDIRSELPESIRALGPDRIDIMLDSIRSGKDPVKVPKDSKPAPAAYDATILKAARRLARGWTPERPIKAPQSLTDFVRKNGGLNILASEAGDIRAADLAKIPGLLQKKGKNKGKSADLLAQAAMDVGFRFGSETRFGSGVDVDAFIKALEADATGRSKVYPDDADTAAFQVQQDYFNEFFRWLKDDLGWEPKGRTPEEIAKFLSQDDTTQRLMALAERVDALGPDSLEARQLDRELARIKDESLQRLWDEFDERDAAASAVDGGPSVPDTGGLSREEWERLHGDIAGTIDAQGATDQGVGEGQSAWLDAEGIVGGQAGNGSAPLTPQEAARARRAEALGKFQSERQQLADALESLGIDPQWSNAKIRKALDAAAKPGGRTYEQAGQIKSDAFKKWFGNSKVVDESGKPLVVYKGGPTKAWQDGSEITAFDSPNGPWAGFFTSDRAVASRFADAQWMMTENGGQPAGVFPVFLSMQKPLVVDAKGRPAREFQIDASVIGKPDSPIREQMLSGDYDGLILRNTADEGDVYVPLKPEQIKSATGNSGAFDPSSPRIYNQSVYHGSPHIFDKFTLDKIGTGEGAQAYGWGLYFAGNKAVAKYYREALAKPADVQWGDGRTRYQVRQDILSNAWRALPDNLNTPDLMAEVARLVDNLTRVYDNMARPREAGGRGSADLIDVDIAQKVDQFGKEAAAQPDSVAAQISKAVIDAIAEAPRPQWVENKGRLYHVEIPDDGAYLLWDKPLADQPETVKAALAKIGIKPEDAPKPPADRVIASIVRRALKANEGNPDGIALVIDNDAELDRMARQHARYSKATIGEDGPGAYVEEQAKGYLKALRDSEANTGERIYKALSERLAKPAPDEMENPGGPRGWGVVVNTRDGKMADDKAASLALREAGIPGIKYLDGGSRRAGEGDYNYVLFDDALATIQQYEQTERGNISFTDNGAIIRLFQGRDLSTLIHESGHLWLAELEFDAKAQNASEETKAMWQTVLDYVGSKDGYITVEQHELFARAFEAYTMEGKAPSEGLRAAFRSFKNWLVTIYRTLARLNAPLSPEIRQVFDRLLATDEEIAAARTTQGLNPLFADAKSAEMTEAEFKAYTANVTRVVDEAEQKVLAKVMAQIKREKTKELAAEKARIRKEVTAEMMADPGQGALYFLRNGKLFEGETPEAMAGKKLDRPSLVALIGEDGLKLLPKGIYSEDGLSPDDVAQTFGLGNGTELTDRLLQIQAEQEAMRAKGDNRSVVNVRIAEETQRRLTEAMGDPLNDGSIEAEAMAAVHSDKQGALMASEVKVLARKAGHSGVISLENIKDWAAKAIGEMSTYQGTQFAKYQQAERVAGQRVQRALVKGDFMAAFKAKQDQLVNFALYQEAKKAADDTEKARKLADRYASARTIPNMEQATLDAIHEVLEEFDFKKRSGKLLAERTLFNAWAAEQEKAGHVVVEPPRLKGAQRKHFSQMTVDEIRGLHDSIAQMAHLGRLKKELIVNGQKRDLDNLLTEMEASAEKLVQRGVSQFREGESLLQEQLGDLRHNFTDLRSSLIKMERLFEILDGDKTGRGIFSRALFKPIADAQTVDYDLKVAANKAIKAIYDKVPKEQRKAWATRHSVPEVQAGLTLTKEQIIAIALNTGNASNLEKLLQGRKWSQVGVTALLDKHLTQEEWTFVQDIWDHIDSYWPQIEALEKEVNGFAPKKVEATPVQTRFGTLRGGYYPMEYNRHASFKADKIARIRETTAAVGELFAPGRAKPSTRAGSTNERVENFNAPVLLSLNVIHNHINEVTQDIAYRKAVMQTYKIITSDRFRGAVQSAVGPEYEGQILTWLQRIANEGVQDKVGLSGVESVLRTMRLNVSIVGMGLRVSTMLQQTVGYSNSIQRLGEAAMANGFRLFASNPKGMAETVFAKSGEMRHRMNGIDRDMRANMKRFTGKEGIRPSVARFAFKGIALFDMAVTLPTWLGAYHQGLGQKMTEQEAIYYADKMVRDTQGAGGNKDMSSLQNGNEAWKLFTMFGSYANVLYNAQLGLWTDARYGKMTAKKFATLMHQFLYLMVIPPLLSALVVDKGPEDDEDWLLWAARNVGFGAFQGVPLLRDAANATKNLVEGKFSNGVQLTPIAGIFENLMHLGKDATKIVQGEEPSKTALKNLFNTMGGVMGLPLGQPGLTLQYILDASTGVEDPEDLWDWVRGLTIGPPKKK